MSNSIFITGIAGFIGFHAARALTQQGHSVVGVDNFNDYYNPRLKEKRAAILEEEGIEIRKGDVADFAFLEDAVKAQPISHILHLAAQAGVRHSLKDPRSYIHSNIDGFLSVLEAVRFNPSIKLCYASSSSVYGLNEKIPYAVEDRCDRQASLYGVTKKTNELMATAYHHLFGITAIGLRFFTVYGPWGRPDMAYFHFTESILRGKEIELYHEGECMRDFTYIDDIVEGILSALQMEGSKVYNLGNNKPVKVDHFVQVLEKLLGKKAKIKMLPLQKGDVVATWADIEESERELHFHPRHSLEEGLKKFVEWYKEDYQNIH